MSEGVASPYGVELEYVGPASNPKLSGQDVASGRWLRMIREQEVQASNPLNERAAAHPATGCGSNNNGIQRKSTFKKGTRENPRRQLAQQVASARCQEPPLTKAADIAHRSLSGNDLYDQRIPLHR
jgi:hypothetical protein